MWLAHRTDPDDLDDVIEVARQRDLEEALGLSASHLSQVLNRMEEYGLIQRERIGREKRVALGPAGVRELTRLGRPVAAAAAAAVARATT